MLILFPGQKTYKTHFILKIPFTGGEGEGGETVQEEESEAQAVLQQTSHKDTLRHREHSRDFTRAEVQRNLPSLWAAIPHTCHPYNTTHQLYFKKLKDYQAQKNQYSIYLQRR